MHFEDVVQFPFTHASHKFPYNLPNNVSPTILGKQEIPENINTICQQN